MAFVRPRARILERSVTSGSGPFALGGAVDGSYNTFASFMAIGDTTYISVAEPGAAFWTGIATYSATNQITLTTVEESKGSFGAGTKEIFAGALASTSMFREDISGATLTTGSGSYSVASFRRYATLAQLDGNLIAFTPHRTDTSGAPNLEVDGLATRPIRQMPGVDLLPGVLIQGTPYLTLYNNADGCFYLHGFYGNPYNVPLASGMDYWGPSAPNSAFAFPIGQTISTTTYATLFAILGTTYNIGGEPGGTFRLPDKTGRVSAMREASASRLTSTYFGGNSTVLGAAGGSESHVLTAAEMPVHSHTLHDPGHGHTIPHGKVVDGTNTPGQLQGANTNGADIASNGSVTGITMDNAGGGTAHAIVQPTIVCNYIMRIL